MKVTEKYFGIKERIYSLTKQDIVGACIDLINKKYPARDMQGCTKTDWEFYSEVGEITEEVEKFIYVESFKKDYHNEQKEMQGEKEILRERCKESS